MAFEDDLRRLNNRLAGRPEDDDGLGGVALRTQAGQGGRSTGRERAEQRSAERNKTFLEQAGELGLSLGGIRQAPQNRGFGKPDEGFFRSEEERLARIAGSPVGGGLISSKQEAPVEGQQVEEIDLTQAEPLEQIEEVAEIPTDFGVDPFAQADAPIFRGPQVGESPDVLAARLRDLASETPLQTLGREFSTGAERLRDLLLGNVPGLAELTGNVPESATEALGVQRQIAGIPEDRIAGPDRGTTVTGEQLAQEAEGRERSRVAQEQAGVQEIQTLEDQLASDQQDLLQEQERQAGIDLAVWRELGAFEGTGMSATDFLLQANSQRGAQ